MNNNNQTEDSLPSVPSLPKKVFIGVAWPYVNGNIHFGHLAGYLLPADFLARFYRLTGAEVLMVSGSDCFGTPITIEADKRNMTPEEVVNEYHPKHEALFKELNLSFDLYTKTDNPVHLRVVQDVFVTLAEKGFIYTESSEQYYSESENRFLPDRYVEGECPKCGDKEARSDQCDECGSVLSQGELINPVSKMTKQPVGMKTTEHYFFNWPKLNDFLKDYLKDKKAPWRDWVYNEAAQWLNEGLKPRAITRDLDWGVPIPEDRLPKELRIAGTDHKRIYVWFEAVIGYLSASIKWSEEREGKTKEQETENSEKWKDFWYDQEARHYYFAGKDNLVFHALFWPGQLHGYDEKLHLPDMPAINQFLTLNDQAFSKSFGVTLDPKKMLLDFDLDLIRFYLCLIMPENKDSDFNWDDFIAKTNNLLIANLGNFIFRSLKLAQDLDLKEIQADEKVVKLCEQTLIEAKQLMINCKFKAYGEKLLELSAYANKYLSDTAPWQLRKTDPKSADKVLVGALTAVATINILIAPLIPKTADLLSTMLSLETEEKRQWPKEGELQNIVKMIKIKEAEPLFKKIELKTEGFNEKYK